MLALAIASPAAPVPASSGDPLTNDDGYLGGAITTPPDEQRGPASWIQFAGMGLVTGAKYTTAGIETGLDWITGGLGQASSDSASNTGHCFQDLNTDTASDFGTLAEGGSMGRRKLGASTEAEPAEKGGWMPFAQQGAATGAGFAAQGEAYQASGAATGDAFGTLSEGMATPPEEKRGGALLDGALLMTGHDELLGMELAEQGHPMLGLAAMEMGEHRREERREEEYRDEERYREEVSRYHYQPQYRHEERYGYGEPFHHEHYGDYHRGGRWLESSEDGAADAADSSAEASEAGPSSEPTAAPEEKKLGALLLDGALLATGHDNALGVALASQGHPVAGYMAIQHGERRDEERRREEERRCEEEWRRQQRYGYGYDRYDRDRYNHHQSMLGR